MEEEKPSYYAIIPASVRYDDNLKLGEKMMYGEITALSNKTGTCYASNNYFARLYKVSPQAISKWIKALENNKYITISYEKNGEAITKRVIEMVSTTVDRGINSSLGGYQQEIKENNINIYNNTSKENNISFNKDIFKEIVFYLNEKTQKNYRDNGKETIKLITARINDGFTINDFKKVIDNKTNDWLNTEMDKFLRPSTLFGNKFEQYLNEKQIKKKETQQEITERLRKWAEEQEKIEEENKNG